MTKKIFAVLMLLVGSSLAQQTGGGGGGVPGGGGTGGVTTASPLQGTTALSCPTCGVTGSPLSQFATGGTIGPKIINGVGYSNRYTGTTLDVRVNACIADAEALANGNTSGICDSTGEGSTQTIAAQINVGDSGNDTVTWRLPAVCNWGSTINNGTGSAIFQYSNTNIEGSGGHYECKIVGAVNSTSSSTGTYALYSNNGVVAANGTGYYRGSKFALFSNGNKMASGFTWYIPGAYDNSVWSDIEVADSTATDTAGIEIAPTGSGSIVCCSTAFYNITSNSGYTGPIPLDIESSGSNYVQNIRFMGGSFDHPKAGQPNMKINDSTNVLSVRFTGTIYEEGGNADTTTTFNQITGGGVIQFDLLDAVAETSSSTATVISLASGSTAILTIGGFSANGSRTLSPIVSDSSTFCSSAPCITNSNAQGNLSNYSNVALPVPTTAHLDLTNQSTGTSFTNILFTSAAAQYRISYYLDQSAGCTTVGSGKITYNFYWTDATGTRDTSTATFTPSTTATGTGLFQTGTMFIYAPAFSNLGYVATYTACTTGTWTYDLHVGIEQMK